MIYYAHPEDQGGLILREKILFRPYSSHSSESQILILKISFKYLQIEII